MFKLLPALFTHQIQAFLETLTIAFHAFMSSWLDHCNALYAGLSQLAFSSTTHAERCKSTWHLGCHHSIGFQFAFTDYLKLLVVFKAIPRLAPLYLCEILTIHDQGRALHSSGQLLLDVPRSLCKLWPFLCCRNSQTVVTISPPDVGLFKSKRK